MNCSFLAPPTALNNGAWADPCCVGPDEVYMHSTVTLNEVEVDTINHSPIDSEFTLWSWVIVRALVSGTQCNTQCKENIMCLMKPLIGKILHQVTYWCAWLSKDKIHSAVTFTCLITSWLQCCNLSLLQGIVNDEAVPWRITHKNQNYELCDTYPAVVSHASWRSTVPMVVGWLAMNAAGCFLCFLHCAAGSSQISQWWWSLPGSQL